MPRFDVRAVVFDMDGVLVDSESFNVRSAFEAFAAIGTPLDPADDREIVGLHPDDYVPRLARRLGLSDARQTELRDVQTGIYGRLWRTEAALTRGTTDVLPWLRDRGYRLAVATSGGRSHVDYCLDRFELRDFFELVRTREDVSRRKPDPEIYLRCATDLGLDPAEMLVVEDSLAGVRAAVAAGARCAGLRSDVAPPNSIREAEVQLAELLDLRVLL